MKIVLKFFITLVKVCITIIFMPVVLFFITYGFVEHCDEVENNNK